MHHSDGSSAPAVAPFRCEISIDLQPFTNSTLSSAERDAVNSEVVNEISKQLTDAITNGITDLAQREAVLLSACCFAMNNNFSLREYVKNSKDAHATSIHFILTANDNTVTGAMYDNGEGMPRCNVHLMSGAVTSGVETTPMNLYLYADEISHADNESELVLVYRWKGDSTDDHVTTLRRGEQLSDEQFDVLSELMGQQQASAGINMDSDITAAAKDAYFAVVKIAQEAGHLSALNFSKHDSGLINYNEKLNERGVLPSRIKHFETRTADSEVAVNDATATTRGAPTGGRGRGIADGNEVLNLLGGSCLIGNMRNIPDAAREQLSIDSDSNTEGAALVFLSPTYSLAALKDYAHTDTYKNNNNPKRYTSYVLEQTNFSQSINDAINSEEVVALRLPPRFSLSMAREPEEDLSSEISEISIISDVSDSDSDRSITPPPSLDTIDETEELDEFTNLRVESDLMSPGVAGLAPTPEVNSRTKSFSLNLPHSATAAGSRLTLFGNSRSRSQSFGDETQPTNENKNKLEKK